MKNSRIYPNAHLGKYFFIDDFVIIGIPPKNAEEGEFEITIGDNSRIRSHTVIYAGNKIGKNFQTGHHVMIREHNYIGDNVSIGTNTVIEHHIKIGNNVRIHSNAFIPEFSILEDGAWIGPNVVLTNAYHPLCPKAKECLKGPTISRNAKIGANSTILPDIKIGDNSLIGAGSVVVKDVPPNVVVAGNPAKIIKNINELRCPYKLILKPY
jgi:acetyltransferase-like isoleucine patch superfamily enzyme